MRQGFRRQLALRGGLVLVAVALLAAPACENNRTKLSEEQSEGGLGLSDVSSSGRKVTIDPRCELNETVVEPAEDSPEWVIYQLLDAARAPEDNEDTFQRFYAQFDGSTQAESWVRQQYWPRARKHVTKYLKGDPSQGVTYTVCERRQEADGRVKIFIQSSDPNKSNPPIAVKKDDGGKWKVVFYTP